MANDNVYIYDYLTNEEIVREMTDKEQVSRNAEIAANDAKKQADKVAAEQAATDKAALLAKLGINADEAKLLLS